MNPLSLTMFDRIMMNIYPLGIWLPTPSNPNGMPARHLFNRIAPDQTKKSRARKEAESYPGSRNYYILTHLSSLHLNFSPGYACYAVIRDAPS